MMLGNANESCHAMQTLLNTLSKYFDQFLFARLQKVIRKPKVFKMCQRYLISITHTRASVRKKSQHWL